MSLDTPINITHKNEITKIADTLIRARDLILESNEDINLSTNQQLRLVLICCLALMKKYYSSLNTHENSSNSFHNICAYFEKISNGKSDWVKDYISLQYDVDLSKVIQEIQSSYNPETFPYLLPYALEVLEYSEYDLERAERDRRNGIVTVKKKKRGIYYTPNDIAFYMVDICTKELMKLPNYVSLENYKFVDYSCGSGIFLLQVLNILITCHVNDFEKCISIIQSSLFGIDISPYAVDITRFLIICYISLLFGDRKLDYDSLIKILNQNIICADATNIQALSDEYRHFPKKFNCIIGNPPYVSITERDQSNESNFRSNLFIPFVNNLIDCSESCSVSSLIIPLSFTYSSHKGFKKLRKRIEQDTAVWKIENYDRSPDSLFGDDVKSRNCIIIRKSNGLSKNIFTTGLLRWTSINRNDFLLSPKKYSDITDISIEPFIPKLGSAIELKAYKVLSNNETSLLKILKPASPESKAKLVLNSTAYNWICAYDHIPPSIDEYGNAYISKDKKYFTTDSIEDLYFSIACLNSVTAYWLWTVTGDGFHVTNRFLEHFGIEKRLFTTTTYTQLFKLGKQFSKELVCYPTQSINKGKIITNYDHSKLMPIVLKIDNLIAESFLLPDGFPTYLHAWYSQIVSCGRLAKIKNNAERSYY